MTREDKNKLIKLMLQSRKEEMEEIEKGIVIATMKLEAMVGPNMDIRMASVFRKRREELEQEYVKLKDEISTLESGELPEQIKKNTVEKARENLRRVEAAIKEKKEKINSGIDDINDRVGPSKA